MAAGRITEREWLEVIQAEFVEMPGLTLTVSQAQRLWGLDAATCAVLLGQLAEINFLRPTNDGRYRRVRSEA